LLFDPAPFDIVDVYPSSSRCHYSFIRTSSEMFCPMFPDSFPRPLFADDLKFWWTSKSFDKGTSLSMKIISPPLLFFVLIFRLGHFCFRRYFSFICRFLHFRLLPNKLSVCFRFPSLFGSGWSCDLVVGNSCKIPIFLLNEQFQRVFTFFFCFLVLAFEIL